MIRSPHASAVPTADGRVVSELVRLVGALGRGGGVVSPAVYDTAQVARFAPPREGAGPALDWLVAGQDGDGGWGRPAQAVSRHVSTLAAMLVLAGRRDAASRDAVASGARFLRASSDAWKEADADDLPVGGELILRRLVLDAAEAGLDVDAEPYEAVLAAAEPRAAAIAASSWPAGTPPLSVWEAWGTVPDPAEQSPAGDVGTCPAATARWLASGVDGPAALRASAYLERAAAATGTGVPGVVPFVFPFERMEQGFSLYALVLAGASLPPAVRAAVEPHLDDLEAMFRARGGASHTDVFVIDGDDTAVVACVLATFGRTVDEEAIRRFRRDDHFRTWDFEFTPSLTTTAHCLHALALLGARCEPALRFLLERRSEHGLWESDKWHTSWCYATVHCVAALGALAEHDALARAARAIRERQRPDGGFGGGARSTPVETAYAVLALASIERALGDAGGAREALRAAGAYLRSGHGRGAAPRLWIGKEQYVMPRIDRTWELAAMLAAGA